MTVDHVGFILLSEGTTEYIILRIIGRLSYPLFALIIAYGCTRTRNISMYFLRLIAFAVILQICWAAAGLINEDLKPEFNNIFFTLAFGVLAIWFIKYMRRGAPMKNTTDLIVFTIFAILFTAILCVCAGFLQVDYGAAGVLLIVMFYSVLDTIYRVPKRYSDVSNLTKDWVLRIVAPLVCLIIFNVVISLWYNVWGTQWFSMLSAPLIWLFVPKKLKIHWLEKYAFYIYYPLHFIVLIGISLLII